MVFLTGTLASLPISFFIKTGSSFLLIKGSNGFKTKSEGIWAISTITLITGVIISFGEEIVENIVGFVQNHLAFSPYITSYLPVTQEVATLFGLGLFFGWINLHLTVDDFNIDSLGNSKKENGLFWIITLSLILF